MSLTRDFRRAPRKLGQPRAIHAVLDLDPRCCMRGNIAERLTNLKGSAETTDGISCQCAEEYYWSMVTPPFKPGW